jgi:preprotein translocase subunit Sec63
MTFLLCKLYLINQLHNKEEKLLEDIVEMKNSLELNIILFVVSSKSQIVLGYLECVSSFGNAFRCDKL